MNTNIDDLVARLQQQEAAFTAARNALNEKTALAQTAFYNREQQLGLVIRTLASGPREIDAEQALIADLEERRAMVLTKLTELEQQILDAPDWRSFTDGRARDKEFDRQQTLKQELQLLRTGRLLSGPRDVYPRIEDLDARLKASSERIEQLRAQLAADLAHAEALLGETVTS